MSIAAKASGRPAFLYAERNGDAGSRSLSQLLLCTSGGRDRKRGSDHREHGADVADSRMDQVVTGHDRPESWGSLFSPCSSVCAVFPLYSSSVLNSCSNTPANSCAVADH